MSLTLGQTTTRAGTRATSLSRRIPWHRVLFHLTCLIVAALFLVPVIFTILAAFRPAQEAGSPPLPPWPRQGFSIASFTRLNGLGTGILHYAANSLLVAVGTAALTVIVATLAGYAFSRFRFPLKGPIFILILATIMVPFQSILTPLFLILIKCGLQNSLIGLMLVYVTVQATIFDFHDAQRVRCGAQRDRGSGTA